VKTEKWLNWKQELGVVKLNQWMGLRYSFLICTLQHGNWRFK